MDSLCLIQTGISQKHGGETVEQVHAKHTITAMNDFSFVQCEHSSWLGLFMGRLGHRMLKIRETVDESEKQS